MTAVTKTLSRFAVEFDLARVPESVVAKAKQHILDQLGVTLACIDLPGVRSVKSYAAQFGKRGSASVILSPERLDAEPAALVNATAGHGFELDDYHPDSLSHPSVVSLIPALAVGEETGASGAELLAAYICAVEVSARIGIGVQPSSMYDRGFHAVSILGPFAAAVAASRLMGLGEGTVATAMSIAGSHASGTTEYSAGDDGEVKRFHAGMAAAAGIRAARLAAEGMRAPATIVEGERGFLQAFSDHADPAAVVEDLGRRWELLRCAIKPYACCGLIHAPIDALSTLCVDMGLRPSDIGEIRVATNRLARRHVGVVGPEPSSLSAAQFSLHYSLGMTIADAGNQMGHYLAAERRGFGGSAAKVAARVHLETDEEAEAAFPERFLARVDVVTRDGATMSRTAAARGTANNPLPQPDVERKFLGLAEAAGIGESGAGQIMQAVSELERLSSVRDLTRLLKREIERETPANAGVSF